MKQPSNPKASSDSAIAFFLALFLFGVYLLSFSGRITSSDGLSMFAVTESAVKRGDVSTDQMWTFFGTKSAPAPGGEVYSKYGYGTSLLAALLYAVALYVPYFGLMSLTVLSSAIAMALACALVYLTARRMNFSIAVAIATTLLFGLATPALVYAKEFWSEPFALATLLAAFYFLLVYRQEKRAQAAMFAGLCLGLAVAVRTTNLILLPLSVWYAFWEPSKGAEEQFRLRRQKIVKRQSRIDWRALIWFLVPIGGFVVAIFFYNEIRFGNPLTTGYRADETFSNNILLGVYGLLFSPGKGLFVYAPFLAALPFGVWQFYKRFHRELFFTVILFTVYCLLFSAWYYWWGGTNWAARFLVPTLPFLVLMCAPLLELILRKPKTRAQFALTIVFGLLAVMSLVNELAGVSIHSLTYRLALLKVSDNADWASIFQPALSPLIGHWQILKPSNLEFAWLHTSADGAQVDWIAILLTLGVTLFALYMLVRVLRSEEMPRVATRINVALAIILTLLVVARYADDPRLGGSTGYQKLLATVQQKASAQDVMILNDDANARYFFNANRASIKWYGLSRDPARWDAPAQALVTRLGQEYAQVWFAYDDAVDAPNPMRDWFAEHWQQIQRVDFSDRVHLILYKGMMQ